MENWLNYHHLFYFKTIANEGGVAKAAQRLRLGQPTLSAQLKQFEENLGIKLFERSHKRLVLTESGRVALEYANEIFRMGSEMVEVLHDRLTPTRTDVQLGALDSVPKQLIYSLVKAAYEVSPCSVSVLEGPDDHLLRELLAHRIDLVLTNHLPPISDSRKVYSRKLERMSVVVCGSPRFKDLRRDFPYSLSQKPLVMPTKHSKLRHDLDHYFETNNIQPDIIAETQDTSLQKILGAQGLGLIPIAEPAVEAMLKSKDLIQIGTLEGVYEELYLMAASRKIVNSVSSHLLKNFNFDT